MQSRRQVGVEPRLEREPEDQLVEEQDQPLVPSRAGMTRELSEPGVKVDVSGGIAAHRLRIARLASPDLAL